MKGLSTGYLGAFRLFSRNVRFYLASSGLAGFSYDGIWCVLFNLYLLRLGYGPEFVGLANAVGWSPIVLLSLPAGIVGARWGVRRTMIAGMILFAAGLCLTPLAELVPTGLRTAWLLATLPIGGLGAALWMVNGGPYVMNSSTPQERNHVFSVLVALGPLVAFVGSAVGGLLPALLARTLGLAMSSSTPYCYALLAAGVSLIPAILALIAAQEVEIDRTDARPTGEQSAANGGRAAVYTLIALASLVGMFRVTAENAGRTFFNVYLDASLGTSTAGIGTLRAVGQLLGGGAALVTPMLVARWGKGRTIMWGALGSALSLLPLSLVPHWAAAGVGFMGVLAMAGVARIAFTVFTQEMVAPRWQPAMSGAATMAVGLSATLVSFGGGYAIAAFGYPLFFVASGCLTAIGVLIFWLYFRVPRGELARLAPDRTDPGRRAQASGLT